jgi:hypothetical protein
MRSDEIGWMCASTSTVTIAITITTVIASSGEWWLRRILNNVLNGVEGNVCRMDIIVVIAEMSGFIEY